MVWNLKHLLKTRSRRRRSSNRKVIWTNPLYSLNVKIGKVHCTKNHVFFSFFWKDGLSTKIALEYDFSCIIRKDDIFLPPKISSCSLDEKWRMIFLEKIHGNKNTVFPKKLHWIWSLLFYYLGRWYFFFQKIWSYSLDGN